MATEAEQAVELYVPLHGAKPTLLSCAWCRHNALDMTPRMRPHRDPFYPFTKSNRYQTPSEEEIVAWFEAHEKCAERAERDRTRVGYEE